MFKSYTSNDNLLLPPCLGDFIPQNDPVRVVHHIIEQINLEELYRKYSTKGCSAYHPRMMLQILVYAYLRNIYSSRRIEEFCRNDIRFMWLTGNVTPDHNTINRFRSSRLKDVLKTIFSPLRLGCLLLGLGLGLLVGYSLALVSQPEYFTEEVSHTVKETVSIIYAASVLLGGGLGSVVAFLIEVKCAGKQEE